MFKSRFNKLKPKIIKGVSNTLQGYLFGCMIGILTKKESIHNSGKDLAKVCAIYSTTEAVLETVRDKEDFYSKFVSGAVTGGICGMGPTYKALGSLSLGLYSGFNQK